MSLIDRVAGGLYTPPASQPLAMPRQLGRVSTPEKNNEVKPAAEAVAAPKKVETPVKKPAKKPAEKPAEKPTEKPAEKSVTVEDSEAAEIEAYKKKLAQEKIDKDIKAYAQRKAQKDAAAKLKNK
jgi:hypothetical protein